jgi:hypothetical protein
METDDGFFSNAIPADPARHNGAPGSGYLPKVESLGSAASITGVARAEAAAAIVREALAGRRPVGPVRIE